MSALATMVLVVGLSTADAAGDAARGARVFTQCMACHSTTPGEQLTGPSLALIWNRGAASVEGFHRYSDALQKSDLKWNAPTLDKWLASPEKLVPGTSMTFPGLKDPQQRQDVIAYLQALAEGKAPPPAGGGGMAMQRQMLDLKTAPAEGRVTAVKYCADTYTIDTADGKSQKIWEFNLRFKSDASKLGPAPGKPVVVGAGMQGDRASIVFASPKEISATIQQSCQ